MVRVVSLSTTDVSTRRVSADQFFPVFGVCLDSVRLWAPIIHAVLYPRENTIEALPK